MKRGWYVTCQAIIQALVVLSRRDAQTLRLASGHDLPMHVGIFLLPVAAAGGELRCLKRLYTIESGPQEGGTQTSDHSQSYADEDGSVFGVTHLLY